MKQKFPLKLDLQLFAADEDEKSKLEKHLEELGEQTTGGAHDAVTFSGKGLALLKGLFKSKKKAQENDDMDDDDDEDEIKKNAANGGDLDEEDEDPDDPADKGDDDIISNKGDRKSKASLKSAVSKSDRAFDERRFEKNLAEHEDIMDASPALKELSQTIRSLGKSVNGSTVAIGEIQEQNMILAKAVRELLKSQAALASDLELIKSQPATNPSPGFVVLTKQEGGGQGKRLSKSHIEDTVTDAVNEGLVQASSLAQLGRARSTDELKNFVENLPASVRERL